MSDAFEELTGPATLGDDDAVADLSVVDEEEEVDPIVDPVVEEEIEEEEDEEDEDSDAKETEDLIFDALYSDRE